MVKTLKRHRGKFDPDNPSPYELSRSRIENFIRCPACFYLQQVRGIKYPSIPGFNINEATDILLKRDFDQYRGGEQTHPFLVKRGMSHLVPYQHKDFELWTQSLHFGSEGRMHTVHKPSKIKFGGGLDDIWRNTQTDELHIVDYKSTSQKAKGKQITLDDKWKAAYKRQMDMYVWIMRHKGFTVSSTGYFLYCDGDRFSDYEFLRIDEAVMRFEMSLIPYVVNTDWIEPKLLQIKDCLKSNTMPAHDEDCEHGKFLEAVIHSTKI